MSRKKRAGVRVITFHPVQHYEIGVTAYLSQSVTKKMIIWEKQYSDLTNAGGKWT